MIASRSSWQRIDEADLEISECSDLLNLEVWKCGDNLPLAGRIGERRDLLHSKVFERRDNFDLVVWECRYILNPAENFLDIRFRRRDVCPSYVGKCEGQRGDDDRKERQSTELLLHDLVLRKQCA